MKDFRDFKQCKGQNDNTSRSTCVGCSRIGRRQAGTYNESRVHRAPAGPWKVRETWNGGARLCDTTTPCKL